ncbi:tyrosine-type recombinase/integrase [Nocardia niwae]|uniref:tyrosine-type recombinase/integrase n=1 Tax=Nocardia niwae TaxID=626084 RepID=UPI00350E3F54
MVEYVSGDPCRQGRGSQPAAVATQLQSVVMLGLRIFEACAFDIADVGEEHGHRVLRVVGKGNKVALVPLPPAIGRGIDRAIGDRGSGPILLNTRGRRMDRHCATRRLRRPAQVSVVRLPHLHPHMLRHTFVTTMLDAGVDLGDVQIAARHAPRAPPCATTVPARTSTVTQLHPSAYMASGTWQLTQHTHMPICARRVLSRVCNPPARSCGPRM